VKNKTLLATLALWIAAGLFGFFVIAVTFDRTFIGLDTSAFLAGDSADAVMRRLGMNAGFSLAGLFWVIAGVVGSGVVTFFVVRGSARSRVAQTDPGRRRFLTGAASGAGAGLVAMLAAGGAAAARALFGYGNPGNGWAQVGGEIFAEVAKTHPEYPERWKGSRVKAHRRLGRTGWQVSDIVTGSGPISGEKGEAVIRACLDRGVNYVDTAPDYSAHGSEQAVGLAIQGKRDQIFLATKFCTAAGHLPPGTPVARYMEEVESSLKRLRTDHVDLVHIHSCDEIDRLMDPNVHEAFDRLKEQGKVRFLGVSTHTPNLVNVADAAIESGRFDVMMLAYHHGIWPEIGRVIERARREQDMGIVAMKTLKGAKHDGLEGFREHSDAYTQAALKWTLSNPDVSCAVISFTEFQHVDEYLYASGAELGRKDVAVPTALPTAAPASSTARRSFRSTTCSATGCTTRITAGRARGCAATRPSPRTPPCVPRAALRAWAAAPSGSRSRNAWREPTRC
jgi:aryl-alcohol dehydrogenase-like predicted oxidoreductase